ncbi:unnamed protein product, partial [Pylaiella littoralis]
FPGRRKALKLPQKSPKLSASRRVSSRSVVPGCASYTASFHYDRPRRFSSWGALCLYHRTITQTLAYSRNFHEPSPAGYGRVQGKAFRFHTIFFRRCLTMRIL